MDRRAGTFANWYYWRVARVFPNISDSRSLQRLAIKYNRAQPLGTQKTLHPDSSRHGSSNFESAVSTLRQIWEAVERAPEADRGKLRAEVRSTMNQLKKRVVNGLEKTAVPSPKRGVLFDKGSDVDLLDWLRQCRRAGLYEQGKAIYEKGGMNSANLTDEQQIEAEDDYRICTRRGSTEEAKPKRKRRKMNEDDE